MATVSTILLPSFRPPLPSFPRKRESRTRGLAGFPPYPYRHSRVSGNPAVACQDCGIIRHYRRDSRLRGNDGREAVGNGLVFSIPFGIPAYAGMTVGAAGMAVMERATTVERAGRTVMERKGQ